MSEAIYTQKQMLKIRNDNYKAGIEAEHSRVVKILNEELEDAIKIGIFSTDTIRKALARVQGA